MNAMDYEMQTSVEYPLILNLTENKNAAQAIDRAA